MQLTAADVARLVSGVVEGSAEVTISGAEVDSRRVEPGDLFVALRGERSDGHAFVGQALEVAAAALVRDDASLDAAPEGSALIRVSDPRAAYWALAAWERRRRGWRIAAVTGSVGKTTTKEMLTALLSSRFEARCSSGNRNSTLGLPAEILSQPEAVDVFVAEAGMNRAGELDTIGGIIAPEVLLYTRIARVHTEFLGGLAEVIRAKAELLPHLDSNGVLVVNADDPNQAGFARKTTATVLSYGGDADVRISGIEDRGLLGSRFTLHLPSDAAEVKLALVGLHQAENLLAAAAAASVFGIAAADVAARAPELEPAPHRGRVHNLEIGATLVDDSYNASPLAMRRLLELLAAAPGRKIAVLGEMYELGAESAAAHRLVGREAAAACDLLIATGGDAAAELAAAARSAGLGPSAVHHAADCEDAAQLLARLLEPGDVVLVKGSRGVGLDRTVAALIGREAA